MKNPKHSEASSAVFIALRNGTLVREPCEHCLGYNWKVEGHHEDYSKPLEVIWLCKLHHRLLHRQKRWHSTEFMTSSYKKPE